MRYRNPLSFYTYNIIYIKTKAMKQTDINSNKLTGEWFKHIRRRWRKPLNRLRRNFLKKDQNNQLNEL